MTGWGQDGPLADRAGHDIDYIALAGALGAVRPRRRAAGRRRSTSSATSAAAGCCSPSGVVAGLLEVARGGEGQVVDAAMVDGTALLMAPFFAAAPDGVLGPAGHQRARLGRALLRQLPSAPTAGGWPSAPSSRSSTPSCSTAWLDAPALPDRDDRANWPALRARFSPTFAARTRDEWAATFGGPRRLRRAGARPRRGAGAPPPRRPRHLHRPRRRRTPEPGPPLLRHPRRASPAAPATPASTRRKSWPTGASTADRVAALEAADSVIAPTTPRRPDPGEAADRVGVAELAGGEAVAGVTRRGARPCRPPRRSRRGGPSCPAGGHEGHAVGEPAPIAGRSRCPRRGGRPGRSSSSRRVMASTTAADWARCSFTSSVSQWAK